jgi:hypothetical protein
MLFHLYKAVLKTMTSFDPQQQQPQHQQNTLSLWKQHRRTKSNIHHVMNNRRNNTTTTGCFVTNRSTRCICGTVMILSLYVCGISIYNSIINYEPARALQIVFLSSLSKSSDDTARTSMTRTDRTTRTTTTSTKEITDITTLRDRVTSFPMIDRLYSYFEYNEDDETTINDDIVTTPLVNKQNLVESRNNDKDNDAESNTDNDDNTLFQEAIRNNFNISKYRNYQEYMTRSQRFPSVEERVKVYMSTWYLPPKLPCNNHDNGDSSLDNDPRIHYNYITQTDPNIGETNIVVILRQSQGIIQDDNYYDEFNNTLLFALEMTPQHSRTPFVYNHSTIIQHSSDRFIQDAIEYFIPSLQRIQYPAATESSSSSSYLRKETSQPPPPIPIILQLGDAEQYRMYSPISDSNHNRPIIPIIKKFRYSMDADEVQRVTTPPSSWNDESDCYDTNDSSSTANEHQPVRVARTIRGMEESDRINPTRSQPIVSVLSNFQRHFNPLNEIDDVDRPWHEKINMAVYRGALTGMNKASMNRKKSKSSEVVEIQWCTEVPRCNLVLQHGTSQYVNAKLVPYKSDIDRVSPVLNNVTMIGGSMNFYEMLQYKAIIMLEGNDVSSGLKWALFSNSVVLMPQPTCTSWAMEELLQPYVHYIPLYDNLTNVEEQVQWMIDHDDIAEQIAINGRLWMTDLIYHPDASKDTEQIIDETFRRYMNHFLYNPSLQVSPSFLLTQ